MYFRKLGKKEFRALYEKYVIYDFPESELKSLRTLLKGMGDGSYVSLGGCDDTTGELLCYAIVMLGKKGEPALVDYLAVLPEKRNQGIGSKALSLFKKALPDACGIFIEYENPADDCDNPSQRVKREAFYLRNGLRRTEIDAYVYGNHFCIAYLPFGQDVEDKQLKRQLSHIYRQFGYRNKVRFADRL